MTETITVRQKSVVKIIHVTEKFRGFWLKVWWDPGVHDSSELGLCPALCSVKQVEVDIGPAPYLSRKCFPSPQMQPESQGRLLLAWIGSRAYPWTNHVWVGWWSKKHRHHFADKGLYNQSYGFSSSHIWMWELDHKEGWMPKNWYFQTVVLEKALERHFDSKKIKPVNPKENKPWIFIGKTYVEAPILCLPFKKSQFIGKDPDAGKDWRQEEKGMTEEEGKFCVLC